MSTTASSIEINGKRYDTKTGQPLGVSLARKQSTNAIDGVISAKSATPVILAAPRIKTPEAIKPLSANKLMDMKAPPRRPRAVAKAAAGHTPQTAHTLMRHVVQKPTKSLKRQHAAQTHTGALVSQPQTTIHPHASLGAIPAARLTRAKHIVKNSKISRFADSTVSSIQSLPSAVSSPSREAFHASKSAKPVDIFEQAMQRATSHQQTPVAHHKHPVRHHFLSKRLVSVSATALAVILLVGLVGYENRANLTLRMAASKAGFTATMPGYKPAGFSVQHLNYSAGNVAITFQSNSDTRAFAITEKPSAWDSATLRDTFVSAADSQYQTMDIAGRTVYIFGKNNAAWVNAGIMYQVKTDGALSDKQLSKLAASL